MPDNVAFDLAFGQTLGHEGGYSNDPDDPGGETKFGISKRQYPNEDIEGLTIERAKEIYRRDYWDKLRLDEVRDPEVAAEIFDTAVNTGIGPAIKIAQRALEFLGQALVVDGAMGAQTLTALNDWCVRDAEVLFKALNGEQYRLYRTIVEGWARAGKKNPFKFSAGWMRRIQAYREVT